MKQQLYSLSELIQEYAPQESLHTDWDKWFDFSTHDKHSLNHIERLAQEIQEGNHFDYPIVVYDASVDEDTGEVLPASVEDGMYRLAAYRMLDRDDITVIKNEYPEKKETHRFIQTTYKLTTDKTEDFEMLHDEVSDFIYEHLSFRHQGEQSYCWIQPITGGYSKDSAYGEITLIGDNTDNIKAQELYDQLQEIFRDDTALDIVKVQIETIDHNDDFVVIDQYGALL